MAKNKIRPADDEDEVETADERPTKKERAPQSRMRWFLSRFVVMLLLLGVLAWFAPLVASYPFVWKPVLGFVMPEVSGNIEIKKLSLGWLSALRVEGLVIKDDQGAVLAEVLSMSSRKTLSGLASDPADL